MCSGCVALCPQEPMGQLLPHAPYTQRQIYRIKGHMVGRGHAHREIAGRPRHQALCDGCDVHIFGWIRQAQAGAGFFRLDLDGSCLFASRIAALTTVTPTSSARGQDYSSLHYKSPFKYMHTHSYTCTDCLEYMTYARIPTTCGIIAKNMLYFVVSGVVEICIRFDDIY